MSIGATRIPRRALVALAALAASVALQGTSAAPASADWTCYPTSQAYWTCYDGGYGVEDRTLSMPNRDVDIGAY